MPTSGRPWQAKCQYRYEYRGQISVFRPVLCPLLGNNNSFWTTIRPEGPRKKLYDRNIGGEWRASSRPDGEIPRICAEVQSGHYVCSLDA